MFSLSSVDPEGSLQSKLATRPKAVKMLHITDAIFLIGATDKKYLNSFQQIPKISGKVQVCRNDPLLLSLEICQVCSLEFLPFKF